MMKEHHCIFHLLKLRINSFLRRISVINSMFESVMYIPLCISKHWIHKYTDSLSMSHCFSIISVSWQTKFYNNGFWPNVTVHTHKFFKPPYDRIVWRMSQYKWHLWDMEENIEAHSSPLSLQWAQQNWGVEFPFWLALTQLQAEHSFATRCAVSFTLHSTEIVVNSGERT